MQHIADFLNTSEYYLSDSNKLEISSGARMKLIDNPGQIFSEDCADDTDWDYDDTKSEFSVGKIQKIYKRPDNAVFYASYTNNENGNWGNGTLVGILGGVANVHDGLLDMTGGNANIEYPIDNFSSLGQKGCIRRRMQFDYSGNAPAIQYLLQTSSDAGSRVYLVHNVNYIQCYITNTETGTIFSMVEAFQAIQGQTVEWELNWDADAGIARLFKNGVLFKKATGTGTINAPSLYRIGQSSNAKIKILDEAVFSIPQHTTDASYTPDWSMFFEYDYIKSVASMPTFNYSGVGSIQSIDDVTIVSTGDIRLITGDKFYNTVSEEWEDVVDPYTDNNTPAEFSANVINFPVQGAGSVTMKVVFLDSNEQASLDSFSIEITGLAYPADDPRVKLAALGLLGVYDILSIAYSGVVIPANTSLGLAFMVNGVSKYYDTNTSSWVSSDLSIGQSNTDWSVLTAEVMQQLIEPNDGNTYTFVLIFHSDDGLATPEISTFTTNYIFWNEESDELPECVIWFYVRDLLGDLNPDDARLYVASEDAFWLNDRLIKNYYKRSEVVDSDGWVQLSVLQTETISQELQFYFKYTDPNDSEEKTIYFNDAIVPAQDTIKGSSLLVVDA